MTRIRPIWLLLALFLVLSHSQASASRLKTPVEISPTRRGTTRVSLYVRARPISIPLQKPFEGLTFSYTGRFYQMGSTDEHPPMLPGPIIHVVPGGKVRLQLFNCLGAEDVTSGESMFSFHDPNTTNIHFHGSHSDPEVDNPFVTAAPGGNLSYKLSIPRGHEPGMHWYHAHSHGSVYYQVMSGLFGAFVVDDGKTLKSPKHPFTDVPSHVLLMHLYRLGPGGCDGMTMNQANGHLPFQPRIHDESGTEHPLPSNLLLVNGQHTPTVPIRQYHDTVLRIGFAAGSCHANLTLPSTCSFHVFAIDGVQLRHTVPRSWLYFTTATRMELVVVCQEDGKFPVIWNHPDSTNSVAFFLGVKAAQEPTSSLTFPAALPRYKPDYLLMSAANYVHWEISMSQRDLPSPKPYYILGQGPDCSLLQNSSTCLYDHFQGELGTNPEKYDGFVIPLNSVVIARVYGDPTDPIPHPLHFHVNHFQVLSFTPRPGGQHANHTLEMYGVHRHEFRDTVPILDGVTTIRWRAATFSGEVVYHCHALHHEDRGMMRSYLVLPHPNRGDERDNVPSPTAPPKPPAFPLFWVFFTLVLAGIVWLALRLCRKLQSLRTSSATTYPNEGTSLLPQ